MSTPFILFGILCIAAGISGAIFLWYKRKVNFSSSRDLIMSCVQVVVSILLGFQFIFGS